MGRYTLMGAGYGDDVGRVDRRTVLRRGCGAVLSGAALWVGVAEAAPSRAAAAPTVVTVVPDASITPVEAELIDRTLAPLLEAHPGLEVKMFPQQLGGYGGALETFMVAGIGPDIFGDFILTGYTSNDLALDLTPYVKQSNLDLGGFMQGQVQYIRQAGLQSPSNPQGLYALPCLTNPTASVVNLGLLDQLGLKYPEPGWTYQDWAKLWTSSATKQQGSKPARAGGVIDWRGYDHTYNMISPWVLKGWGGEYVDPSDTSRCDLATKASIACGEWAYDLVWSGVVNPSAGDSNFADGTAVSHNQDSDDLPNAARLYTSLKWDFFPLPVWPVQATSYTSANFDGIWAGTKHPDASWIVLEWFTASAAWQRLQMRTELYAPSQLSLYPEWLSVVRQVAPPLRNKNLEIFLQQAQANDQYVGDLFRYASNQVKLIVGDLSQQLQNRKATVAEAFTQTANRINALEVAGRTAYAASVRAQRQFTREVAAATASGSIYNFPRPSRTGAGSGPVAAASQVTHKGQTWKVVGGGGGVNGSVDGLTFACAATTASQTSFVCRIATIQADKPAGKLNDGAKFGLMVRADLSDDSPSVGVEVAAGRGVHFHSQSFVGQGLTDQRAGQTPGLLAASQILRSDSSPALNYLSRPIWLKLVRNVTQWSAFTSLDGANWAPAGIGAGAQIAGGWVGIYTSAHGNGDLASATFDNLTGFSPDTFVRVGAA